MESFGREDSGFLRETAGAVSLLFGVGREKEKDPSLAVGSYERV